MPYSLTKTNGSSLINLADGVVNGPDYDVNAASSSVNLVGKNKSGYGFYLNENFIKLLENFAYSTAPVAPLTGQIWWDTTNTVLKVYNGTNWKEITNTNPSTVAPSNPQAGDLWFNPSGALSAYTGSSWLTIGPYTAPSAGLSQFVNNPVQDVLNATRNVGNVVVNNKLAAVVSSESTAFTVSTPILGLTTIQPGFTIDKNLAVGGTISGTGLTITGTATLNGLTIATTSGGGLASFAAINSTVIGNVTPSTGAFTTITASAGAFTTITVSTSIKPTGNLTVDLGDTTHWFNNIYGTAIHAQYADLAERFAADQPMAAGTVVELGGPAEIMAVNQELSDTVFGVISTKAAYLMNSAAGSNDTHPPVAVQGRVPVRVTGIIRKGDRLVSAGNGLARAGARNEITPWNVIGRALENKSDSGEGVIEAVVKLNS